MKKLWKKKISTNIEILTKGLPEELATFLNFAREIRFDEKPDYGYVKSLLKKLMEKEKIEIDFNFDWVQLKKQQEVDTENINKDSTNMYIDVKNDEKLQKTAFANNIKK